MAKSHCPRNLNTEEDDHFQVIPNFTELREVAEKERLKQTVCHNSSARENAKSTEERFIDGIDRNGIEANQEQATNQRDRERQMITAIGNHQPPIRCPLRAGRCIANH